MSFKPSQKNEQDFNGGTKYKNGDGLHADTVNNVIESLLWSQSIATNQPNIENINGDGTPSVSIEEFDGTPRFKFQNLKGEKGIDGKDHSEEIAQLNEKLETYFISAKEQIDINSEEISKNSAKIHNLTNILLENEQVAIAEVSQAFTTRQTADGENIIDNQNIFPKKIAGSTQNCYSLVDFSSAASAKGLTVTANNNTLTISGTPTEDYAKVFSANITDLLENGKTYTMWQSVAFSSATASGAFFMFVIIYDSKGDVVRLVDSAVGQKTFTCNKSNGYIYRIWLQSGTIENVGTINSTISFMLYEGTDEKPYQPYFKGLKNAYFEKVVSTGRQLLDKDDYKIVNSYYGYSIKNLQLGKIYKIGANTKCIQSIKISTESAGEWSRSFGNDFGASNLQKAFSFTTKSYGISGLNELTLKNKYIFIVLLINGVARYASPEDIETYGIKIYEGTVDEYDYIEPYTESELGFSSSPDLAIVEEVAHVNDSSEIAEEAAQYNNSVIYLSDMSNVHVGMLVDFYMDGTIISGATARQIMFLDTEAKYIVVDGADPMEYLPIDTTVRRSAQVKLPEWDYILPQEQKIVRQTRRVEFTGTESFILTHISGSDGSDSIFAYKTGVTSITANKNEIISNKYVTVTDDKTRFFMDDGYIVQGQSALELEYFYIRDDRFSTVDEWKAYLAEQYAAGDPVIVEYKLAEATEEDIVIPNNYTAYQGGFEKVVQGNTDNSEYGAMCTLTNDYFVKVGGATNEQTE